MFADSVVIGNRTIGPGCAPFVVAELSGNHNGSCERALEIIDAAAEAGADAVKLQTFTADTLTLDISEGDFYLGDPKSTWSGTSMYQLYSKAHTPWEWHAALFERCRQRSLVCFSSPFDVTAVDFLETLDPPCYKIASTENTDTRLLRHVAETGKPIIMSCGMATVEDLGLAVATLAKHGCKELVLLKCTAAYPASPHDANLATMRHMREMFGCPVGLSDHSLGIGVAAAGAALGAAVIEKHITLSRSAGGVDSSFSMERPEFAQLVVETRRAWEAVGRVLYNAAPSEDRELSARSLYLVRDVDAGDRLTNENVRSIRPGFGLPSRYLDIALGMTFKRPAKKGTRLEWDFLR